MTTINLGLQIVPKSKTLDSYSLVDKAIEVIQASGVKYEVTPFETVMEGPEEQLMQIARRAQEAVLEAGADEVLVYYRIQIRKDGDVTMSEKTGKYKAQKRI
ncbi:MAG TPA: thiamine-binding protein [Cyclobacteriaceae bacterium]|nr:thiamine-binding protein [Cyclobacteriaceae bacterium]